MFANGAANPTSTLADANLPYIFWLATDSKDDLFVDGLNSGNLAEVDEFKAGSTSPTVLPITGTYPGGLAFDAHDNLIFDDQGSGSSGTISTYAPPYTGAPASSFGYSGDIVNIALTNAKTPTLWGSNSNAGQEYSLAGSLLDSTSSEYLNLPVGIAVSPAAKN